MSAADGSLSDTEPAQDLVALARETAYDRYIQALLVHPKSLRDDFLVMAAIHGELARIPLLVSEPMMGEVRLQWWHDTIVAMDFVAGGAPSAFASPLANHVARFVDRVPEAKTAILNAVEARRCELVSDALDSVSAFERYCDGVATGFLRIAATTLDITIDDMHCNALAAAGTAMATAELTGRLPSLISRGIVMNVSALPSFDAAVDAQVDNSVLTASAAALSTQAHAALRTYRTLQAQGLAPQMINAVLPLALVEPQFRVLQSRRGETSVRPALTPLGRIYRMWRASRRKRI